MFRSTDGFLYAEKTLLEGEICSKTAITQIKGFEPLRRASFFRLMSALTVICSNYLLLNLIHVFFITKLAKSMGISVYIS